MSHTRHSDGTRANWCSRRREAALAKRAKQHRSSFFRELEATRVVITPSQLITPREMSMSVDALGVFVRLLPYSSTAGVSADMTTRARMACVSEYRMRKLWPEMEHLFAPPQFKLRDDLDAVSVKTIQDVIRRPLRHLIDTLVAFWGGQQYTRRGNGHPLDWTGQAGVLSLGLAFTLALLGVVVFGSAGSPKERFIVTWLRGWSDAWHVHAAVSNGSDLVEPGVVLEGAVDPELTLAALKPTPCIWRDGRCFNGQFVRVSGFQLDSDFVPSGFWVFSLGGQCDITFLDNASAIDERALSAKVLELEPDKGAFALKVLNSKGFDAESCPETQDHMVLGGLGALNGRGGVFPGGVGGSRVRFHLSLKGPERSDGDYACNHSDDDERPIGRDCSGQKTIPVWRLLAGGLLLVSGVALVSSGAVVGVLFLFAGLALLFVGVR